jgi:3-oxoacyl-(acyl-carrier-protein) synthase
MALSATGVAADDIGYVNAHGTGTIANDQAEAAAVNAVFSTRRVPISSTKGITGHALGAAGIVEAIVACLALSHQALPVSANAVTPDPALGLDVVTAPRAGSFRYAMSNNFGFGGSNCSLIFERAG